ncbi:MAG: hypothetical protein RLZZ182_1091 [Pseudomonadota bacterium]|jgi:hypothetical protein
MTRYTLTCLSLALLSGLSSLAHASESAAAVAPSAASVPASASSSAAPEFRPGELDALYHYAGLMAVNQYCRPLGLDQSAGIEKLLSAKLGFMRRMADSPKVPTEVRSRMPGVIARTETRRVEPEATTAIHRKLKLASEAEIRQECQVVRSTLIDEAKVLAILEEQVFGKAR